MIAMNFEFTEEQRLFAGDALAAGALARAHDPRFPYAAQRLSRHGLPGITIAEDNGGQGGSRELLKNRIAEDIFERRFDQRGRRADAAR